MASKYKSKIQYETTTDLIDDDLLNDALENEITNNFMISTNTNKYINLVSNVYRQISDPRLISGETIDVNVDKNTIVKVKLDLEYIDDELKHLTPNLTNFDKHVHNVIATFYQYGVEKFTPKNILRFMKENNEGYNPSNISVKEVIESIQKMRFMHVDIDFTNQKHWKAIKEAGLKEFGIDDFILPLRRIRGKKINNNETKYLYYLRDIPPLLLYSQLIKQLENLEREEITIPYNMQLTRDGVEATTYISQRISDMRGKNKKINNKILWATLFKNCIFDFTDPTFKENKHKEYIANRLVKDGHLKKRASNEYLSDYIQRAHDYINDNDSEDFKKYYSEIEAITKRSTNNFIDRKRKKVKKDIDEFLNDKKEKGYISDYEFVGNTTKGHILIKM